MPAGPIALKLGGLAVEEPAEADQLLKAIGALARAEAGGLFIVHGGGRAVTRQLQAMGLESRVVNGVRATPEAHLEQVVGVLAGRINAALVARLNALGFPAVGLTLADGGLGDAETLKHPDVDLGRVGTLTGGDASVLRVLMDAGYIPVVCSIGADDAGRLLNINADACAGGLAAIASARLLLLLSDVPGVLDAAGNTIDTVDERAVAGLVASGAIHGGMIEKTRSALEAANAAGAETVIASWKRPELLEAIVRGEPGPRTKILASSPEGAASA